MSSSVQSWPDYMQQVHNAWLNNFEWTDTTGRSVEWDMDEDINTARSNNPYEDAVAYNPGDRLDTAEDITDVYYDTIYNINPDDEWSSALGKAMTRAAILVTRPMLLPVLTSVTVGSVDVPSVDSIDVDSEIDEAVEALDTDQAPEFMRSVGRFAASMSDINAVQGHSSFMMGLAFIEYGYYNKILGARKELKSAAAQKRMDIKAQGAIAEQQMQFDANKSKRDLEYSESNTYRGLVQKQGAFERQTDLNVESANAQIENNSVERSMANIMTLRSNKRAMLESATRLANEIQRMGMVAEKEQHDTDILYSAKDVLWELDLYQYGANLLAAQSGGVTQTPKMSGTQSLIADISSVFGMAGTVLDFFGVEGEDIGNWASGAVDWIIDKF